MKILQLGIFLAIFHIQTISCQETPIINFSKIANIATNLTPIESFQLKMFINFLVYESHFGFVLTGDKPLAMESLPNHKEITKEWCQSISSFGQMIKFFNIDKGREVFSREGLSWGLNFIYFEDVENNNETTVYLMNKEVFLDTVEKNIKVFRGSLGLRLLSHQILDLCINNKNFRRELVRNPYLLGILLGYGEGNARLYDLKRKINKKHHLKLAAKENKIRKLNIRSCVDFRSLEKAYYPPIYIPGFAGDPDANETKSIVAKFKKARNKIFSQQEYDKK